MIDFVIGLMIGINTWLVYDVSKTRRRAGGE